MEDELARLNAEAAAKRLLGCELVCESQGRTIRVRIVETEAYDESDAASHSYKGRTERTDVMFGKAGTLYVYFTYGMHYCCNVVVGPAGHGAAVLIRAVEPIEGIDHMRANRNKEGVELTNGPAKLCQALAIDKTMNGHLLTEAPLRLRMKRPLAGTNISVTTRVGITKAMDVTWRFYETGNPFVSKPN